MTRPTPLFLLGTHHPGWLRTAGVPLFVSDTRLRGYKTLPRAVAPVCVDSGGFSMLQRHGVWTVGPAEYVRRLRRYRDEIGHLRWAAPQDWMCEDAIIHGGWHGGLYFAGTGLSVAEHQRRTVLNYARLRELADDLNIIPVVQGRDPDTYRRCADLYWTLARVDITRVPLVGVGSICRLQATGLAREILAALHRHGLRRLHGFGLKTLGLLSCGHLLTSADSMAWSRAARHHGTRLPGCHHRARNCANCMRYALTWRGRLLHQLRTRPVQPTLWD